MPLKIMSQCGGRSVVPGRAFGSVKLCGVYEFWGDPRRGPHIVGLPHNKDLNKVPQIRKITSCISK